MILSGRNKAAFMLSLLIIAFCIPSMRVNAQDNAEEKLIMNMINVLFDGMRNADSAAVHSTFYHSARLSTIYIKEGKPNMHDGEVQKFLDAIGTPHEEIYNEKIWNPIIHIDGNLATVWVNYAFYVGETFSHCGVNTFQLFKAVEGWKIVNLIDTRNKEGCETP